MKQKTLLKQLLFLCLLVVGGVNPAWADNLTYTLTISASDFNTTSYAANNNEKTSNAVCTTDNTKTYEVKWTSNQVYKNSSSMQWQRNKGYIYNSTDLGTINSVTVNSSAGSFTTYYGTSEHPTSGTTVGNGFFTTVVGDATGTTSSVVVTFTPLTLTYSATNGSISGVLYNTETAVESGDPVAKGKKVTLTATPADGYAFSSWKVSGTGSELSSTSTNPTTFTMGTANSTVTANFVELDTRAEAGLNYTNASENVLKSAGTFKQTLYNPNSLEGITYSSSDTDVATVAADGTVTLKATGEVDITASFDGDETFKPGEASYKLTITNKNVAELGFENDEVNKLSTDAPFTNALTIEPSNLAVNFSSSDTEVATVASDGEVTIVGAGTTTITATVDDEAYEGTASYTLTVTAAHTATFSVNGATTSQVFVEGATITFPSDPDDIEGKSFVGWATATINGTTDTEPNFVTSATMSTSDLNYYAVFATVESRSGSYTLDYSKESSLSASTAWGSYGTAYPYTATDGGVWVVKAYKSSGMQINTDRDCSIKTPTCSGNITSININCSAAKAVGFSDSDYKGSGTITYVVNGTDAISQTLDFTGKSKTVGYIVPKGGSTSITKIVVNYAGKCSGYATNIAVDPRSKVNMTGFTATSSTIAVGANTATTVTNDQVGWTAAYTYSSSNTGVATVSAAGVVTGVARGTATITATLNVDPEDAGYREGVTTSQTLDISVTEPVVVAAENVTMTYGNAPKAITSTVSDSYAGTLTYVSGNTNVATVDAEGNVTAVAVGTTTITISSGADLEHLYTAGDNVAITVTVNEISEYPSNNQVFLNETFDNCTGTAEIAIDNYDLDNTKWDYSKAYEYSGIIKLGASGTTGYLTTPDLSFTSTANLTFKASGWENNKHTERTIIVTGINCTINDNASITLSELVEGATNLTAYGPYTLTKTGDKPKVKFSTSSTRAFLDEVLVSNTITTVPATIAQNREWATFCSPYVLDFTSAVDGLKGAYYASKANETTVTLTKVTGKVNPGTGLLLRASDIDAEKATTINIPVSTGGATLKGNLLVGTLSPRYVEPTSGDNTNYGLQNSEFHPYSAAGTLGANKAYLQLTTTSARTLTFVVEDETNGIANVHQTSATDNDACYDLQGRRVNLQQKKGLYIRNGKKVLVK